MRNPDVEFAVLEEWDVSENLDQQPRHRQDDSDGEMRTEETVVSNGVDASSTTDRSPVRLFLGRLLASSARSALILKHSLKTRPYISTTSMDATLALITANLARARPGTLVYDPFVGTGGFLVAAAEFGASVWGSDIDGRSFRGTKASPGQKIGKGCSDGIEKNFSAYDLQDKFLDCFIGDVTNSPLRDSLTTDSGACQGFLDAIICDPPYGVREGLKVLGNKEYRPDRAGLMIDGVLAHTLPGYVAPKRQYSFERMLDNILVFAANVLVIGGRLAFWAPHVNEDDKDEDDENTAEPEASTIPKIPVHPQLELVECSVQGFRNWSRRLLVYQKREGSAVIGISEPSRSEKRKHEVHSEAQTASQLNDFRRRYFQGFRR